MINSAEEFISLVESSVVSDNTRAVVEEASDGVWLDIARKYPSYEKYIMQNNTISLDVIGFLSGSKNCDTRHSVAMKRRSGGEILTKLSRDEHPIVRQAVAANKKTPREILKKLCSDVDERVSQVAEYNMRLQDQKLSLKDK